MGGSTHTVFAKRWITRDPSKCSELEMPVTAEEMDRKSDMCELALFWEAHDTMYAVGNEIKGQLTQGQNVVINVSRTCKWCIASQRDLLSFSTRVWHVIRCHSGIQTAQMKFKKVRVINITASENVLLERLTARGRDSEQSIKERVARSKKLEPTGPFVLDVVNEGTREEGIGALVDILRAYEPRPPPRVVLLADAHANSAEQLELAAAIKSMELPDGADLWLEMVLPEEVAAMRAAFEDKSAEEYFLDMEREDKNDEPAAEEYLPKTAEGAGTEAEADPEGTAGEEESESYGGLYCDEAALRQVLQGTLGRLGWPMELEDSMVAVLRTAHRKGSVLHTLDEADYTLAAFEERQRTEQPAPAADGEEEPPPAPSAEAQRFKAQMKYAHDRVNNAAHRFLGRVEAYGGMNARPQLLLCGVEHWQALCDGLKTRGEGEQVELEPVLPAPSGLPTETDGSEPPDAAESTEEKGEESSVDPVGRAAHACQERRALLAPPRSASIFGDEESEDDMEVEPMLAAVMGVHHPTIFAPSKIED